MNGSGVVGRRAELARLEYLAEPRGLRSIPVVVGPSGIGKTTLVTELARRLNNMGDYYFAVVRFYSEPRDLNDLSSVLRRELLSPSARVRLAVRELVKSVLEHVLGSAGGKVVEAVALSPSAPLDLLRELIESLVINVSEREGVKLVIAFDEAQNMIRGLRMELWGFIKLLASLQEEYPRRFQALLVTSDYSFQGLLYREAPSPDYLDTFYLGEMTRSDAEALMEAAWGRSEGEVEEAGNVLEVVGGHPVHIRKVGGRGWRMTYCSMVRGYLQRILELLASATGERREVLRGVLRRLVSQPLSIEEYSEELHAPNGTGFIERLVGEGVLQYSCREYTGIYSWNQDCPAGVDALAETCGGGGLCGGLDTLAPSSRVALTAIARVAGVRPENFPEIGAPEWLRHALSLC